MSKDKRIITFTGTILLESFTF